MTTKVLLARDRVRRLYCLECGDGSLQSLPATGFVDTHTKKHNIKKEVQARSFLVVERPITDDRIKLDQHLSSMFTKPELEWGGAVEKAENYRASARALTKGAD